MQDERSELDRFVVLHASKATLSSDRIVHLVKHAAITPLDIKLVQYTIDDILESDLFDTSSTLVRWLLNQAHSYNPDHEKVIGIIFSAQTVLAHVVR